MDYSVGLYGASALTQTEIRTARDLRGLEDFWADWLGVGTNCWDVSQQWMWRWLSEVCFGRLFSVIAHWKRPRLDCVTNEICRLLSPSSIICAEAVISMSGLMVGVTFGSSYRLTFRQHSFGNEVTWAEGGGLNTETLHLESSHRFAVFMLRNSS